MVHARAKRALAGITIGSDLWRTIDHLVGPATWKLTVSIPTAEVAPSQSTSEEIQLPPHWTLILPLA